eukprot:4649415-Pyramimonas_sp.AAC.1
MTTPRGESVGLRGHRAIWGHGSFSDDVSADRGLRGPQDRVVTDHAVTSLGIPGYYEVTTRSLTTRSSGPGPRKTLA